MTDETTARDRAEQVARLFHDTYERLAPEHGYRTREASAKPWEEVPANNRALMVATVAEVLRALAGAPTADVAIVQAARAWKAKRDQLQYPPPRTRVDDLDVQNTSLPEARALYEAVAAAPEGVDAADEQDTPADDSGCGCQYDSAGRVYVDHCVCGPLQSEHDGMDLEAQGEMADQLAAAQAANQRVRAVCANDAVEVTRGTWWVRRIDVVDALDGDTTEEGR